MKVVRTEPFKRDFRRLLDAIKRRTETALMLLMANRNHPSLRIKKMRREIVKGYDNIFDSSSTAMRRFCHFLRPNYLKLFEATWP
jgi:hypothetical protein